AGTAEFLELLTILRDNGTIKEQDYSRLKSALLAESPAQPTVPAAASPPSPAVAAASAESSVPLKIDTEGGLEIATYDGRFSFGIGGRIMADAAFYNEDRNVLSNGTELRRAQIELDGVIDYDWAYEFEIDFGEGSADVNDAFVTYQGFAPLLFKVGQFKEPFSMDELTSSKYTTFMESALPNAFAPGRHIGIGVANAWEDATVAAGLFGEAFDDAAENTNNKASNRGDESWGVTGRLTWAPLHAKRQVLHLGAASSYRQMGDDVSDHRPRFRARPESHLTNDLRYVDTGKIAAVEDYMLYGLEAAGVQGSFSFQGEYIRADLNRTADSPDLRFDGWYAQASWFWTGEAQNYSVAKGTFGKIKPLNKYGAWETAVRLSRLDLTDGAVRGGEEENVTLALNWYVNQYVRLMANYIWIDNDAEADGGLTGDDDPEVMQFRFQTAF
ncbi:MAG TPA: porin, partial [Desulfurivibrionaceae bacterium]|nr:porin [Desulfurivibrionaceae bacterium]